MTTLFPLFNTSIHVTGKRPTITEKTHTVYQVVDPAGARSYTAIWASVDEKGYVSILKEFPERNLYGEWAKFGDPRWKHGPAADKHFFSVSAYAQEFKKIEEELDIKVFQRIGDSRYFARENEDSIDLFSQFADCGIHFIPSNGINIDTGISSLDKWFEYNPNEPIGPVNKPILNIHESCGNMVDSIINWGHKGKSDEALKDFIDCKRRGTKGLYRLYSVFAYVK
jgi:hypothetical protein